MKKRSSRAKTRTTVKTKNQTQFKNLAIAIVAILVLVIVVTNVKGYRIAVGEAATSDLVRMWPSFLLEDVENDSTLSDSNAVINLKGGATPALPGPTDIMTPYAFVSNTSKHPYYLYGTVYYASGNGASPKMLYGGNCASAIPSGDYVFCVHIDVIDSDNIPVTTTPIKIDTRSATYGRITTLGDSGYWPTLVNSVVPAKAGTDYIVTAMDADVDSPNYLTGPITIVRDGVEFGRYAGSFLQLALSSDGAQVAWVSKSGNRQVFGNGDLYTYNLDTGASQRLYNAGLTQECAGPSLTKTGMFRAFSLIGIDPAAPSILRQYVYINFANENKKIDMSQLPIGSYYHWNSNVKISDNGLGLVWQGKRERVLGPGNRGYNILAAGIFPINADIGDAFQIFPYDGTQRRRLPDLADDGFVIFSNWLGGTSTNYGIFGTRAFKNAPMFSIFNPAGMDLAATFMR